MRIPSEGELIEMQAKFAQLDELAAALEERAGDERMDGNRGHAEELEGDAAILTELSDLADSLFDLVRSQMAVPR
jgi:hypothetical protein